MYIYSKKSQDLLETCSADLIRLFNEVIKYYDCKIICGRRGKEEQDQAFKDGKSEVQYPNSLHNRYPSLAVDVVPYFEKEPHVRWDDLDAFRELGCFVLAMAAALKIEVEWGGFWNSFKDYAHWQVK